MRRCATTGEAEWSAWRTRFQLTPDSASGDRVEREICTARRCRCRCSAIVCQRRRVRGASASVRVPPTLSGVTESASARAVELRLWSSGVPPARRQQGRVESRHAALCSAYRVMAECRRSATMSAVMWGWRDRSRGQGAAALLWHRGVVMLARRGATPLFGNPVRIVQRSVRGHRVRPHHQRAGGTPLCARR